jgi:hypothetical protein
MTNVPTCGFTNCDSSCRLIQREYKCLGSNTKTIVRKKVIFVGCTKCRSNELVWRCVECYSEMGKSIQKNNRLFKMVDVAILRFLSEFEWKSITSENIMQIARCNDSWFVNIKCNWITKDDNSQSLLWKHSCPSCYMHLFPIVPMALAPLGYLGYQPPKVTKVIRYRIQCPQIDAYGRKLDIMSVTVVVLVVQEVMTEDIEKQFLFRHVSELNHNGISNFVSVDNLIGNYDINIETDDWILLLGNSSTNMKVLSLMKKGSIEKYINSKSSNELRCLSTAFAKIAGNSLSEKLDDFSNTNRNNCSRQSKKNRIKGSIWSIALSTIRSSGPNGHAGGLQIDEIRNHLFSGRVTNGIPRTKTATIIVPYYCNRNSCLVTRIQPFYFTIKQKLSDDNFNCISTTPNCALPKSGYITTYNRFWNTISDNDFLKYYNIKERIAISLKKIITEEASNIINGCFILEKLVHLFPNLYQINENIYKTGIEKWNKIKDSVDDGNVDIMLDRLCNSGRLSMVNHGVCGHMDNYNGKSNREQCETLESKFTILLGDRIDDPNFASIKNANTNLGVIPTGGLGFPRYMVYSVCNPLSDLEFHQLTDVIHISGKNYIDSHRGCSVTINEQKQFFPYGAAVTRML